MNVIKFEKKVKTAEVNGVSYKFGAIVEKTTTKVGKDGEETTKVEVIGYDIEPVAIVEDVDEDKMYVRYKYITGTGEERYGHYDIGAIGDGARKRNEVSKMRQRGARVVDMPVPAMADALQAWSDENDNAHMRHNMASQPGFYRLRSGKYVYIAAHDTVIGGDGKWMTDPDSPTLAIRSDKWGTFEQWMEGITRNVTTPGTITALGTSLASPVATLLGVAGFGLHYVGLTSSGKSTALKVAASVWGNPDIVDSGSVVRSWNNTITEMDNIARMMHGASVCLDELGVFRGAGVTLGDIVYNMIGGQSRGRANKDGSSQRKTGWRVTVVSTGEISFRERIGGDYKGGQGVRIADVAIKLGDMTQSAEHAHNIHRDLVDKGSPTAAYGIAGTEWVRYLMENPEALEVIERSRLEVREHLSQFRDGNAEIGRMLDSYELIGASLLTFDHAFADGQLFEGGKQAVLDSLTWLVNAVIEERGTEVDPHERELAKWQIAMESEAGKFPMFTATANGQVWGYVKEELTPDNFPEGGGRYVYTTENLLKASKVVGGGARAFLQTCVDRGQAEQVEEGRQVMISGKRGRWYRFQV